MLASNFLLISYHALSAATATESASYSSYIFHKKAMFAKFHHSCVVYNWLFIPISPTINHSLSPIKSYTGNGRCAEIPQLSTVFAATTMVHHNSCLSHACGSTVSIQKGVNIPTKLWPEVDPNRGTVPVVQSPC